MKWHALIAVLALCWINPARGENPTLEKIAEQQQGRIPRAALDRAFAYLREHADQIKNKDYITIIDFDRPSTEKRMHVIDLKTGAVEDLLVAHGKNSGTNFATKFSNESGSYMSSLGIYLTDAPKPSPNHGIALVLDGMEPTNSRARQRAIILHGADYVSEKYIADNGRLGRSLGCPAVEDGVARRLIEQLKGKSVLLIYRSSTPTTRPSERETDSTAKSTPGEESPAN